MMHPTLQVTEELYIHAACEAIWQRFIQLPDWPRWRSDLRDAQWVQGQSWQEGNSFSLHESNNAGQAATYLIRMVVPADTSVWESSVGVYSLNLAEQVGGCKVTLRCTFHGWGSLLRRLTVAREKANLRAVLTDLKAVMERGGR